MRRLKGISVPDEIAYSTVSITGDKSFTITNYKGIIECTDTKIRVNTPDFVVSITGNNFEINYISEEDISARGTISSVEFVH